MTPRQSLWTLIGATALLRLAWAASLGADTNEAYYYLYTQHPDWSYFDHPPMVAIVGTLGMKLTGGIPVILGMRAGFILLFAGSTWLMARLTSRFYTPWAGVLAAVALNATPYFGLVVGTCAQPDGPLLFFWLLTLDRLADALATPHRLSPWLWVGLAWGGGLLSKYHAVLLPVGIVLFLILSPSARRCLRSPGPYLAVAAGLTLFAPVIAWNAEHGWASFVFQGYRATGPIRFRPDSLAQTIGGQILFLLPWIWIPLVAILVRLVRRGPREWSEAEAFLLCQAAPALALFHGVAAFRGIMPHWPLIGFVALMPLLGRTWSERLAARPGRQSRRLMVMMIIPAVLAGLVVAQARLGLFQKGAGRLLGLIAPADDPTVDLIGWDQVAREMERRGWLDTPGTFLFTDSWRHSAQIGCASRLRIPVACYVRDARSFAYWSRPEDWLGRDGILIGVDDCAAEVDSYGPYFTRIEPLGDYRVLRAGDSVRIIHLFRCIRQTKAYPFGYSRRFATRA